MPSHRKSHKRALSKAIRKAKFQSDLAPVEHTLIQTRKLGHKVFSESTIGERQFPLPPRLERVAQESALPRVSIHWTATEIENLARLATKDPAKPTKALRRAMSR